MEVEVASLQKENRIKELSYWMALHENKHLISYSVKEIIAAYDKYGYIPPTAYDLNLKKYENQIKRLQKKEISIILFVDDEYPAMLKSINDPPLLLYHKGVVKDFDKCVAIIGTRNCSHFGHRQARKISSELARRGYKIVSGLARGIDTEAHCGALDVNGKTIAVLPLGIEYIYPPENEALSKNIAASGALISEVLKSDKYRMERFRFVARNRIISGISKCLIIIEAPEGSRGTIRQFDFAMEQGKKIFILEPQRKLHSSYKGFKHLVDKGGTPFKTLDDILDFLEDKTLLKYV